MNECAVCNERTKKYKCPKCLIPYCNSQCFKNHTCKPVTVKQAINEEVIKSEYIDEEVKLPKAKLELLKQSQKIKKYLTNNRLQKKLLEIDNSKSRFNELNKSLKYDKDFDQFAVDVLETMGLIHNGLFVSF